MSSAELCISKVSTAKFVFSVLGNMRKKKKLCDVKIAVKNQCIAAHRVILAATIPYFRDMFVSGVEEIPEEGVTINEVDLDALESLIYYAYGEDLKITEKNVQTLFVTSQVLRVKDVAFGCENFMATNLNLKNVVEVRTFAEQMSARSLITKCDKYMLENIRDFLESEEFLTLPFRILKDIMEGMAFYRIFSSNKISEKKLFEAIISWIKASHTNNEEPETMLSELFRNIQLERVTLDYLCEIIASEKLIQTSHTCMKLVEKAKAAYVPSTTASVYSQLFYRSSQRALVNWHLKAKSDGSGVYTVCFSEKFGLYIRIYDSVRKKWVTLTQGIPATSCFKHIICQEDRIEIFADETRLSFEVRKLEWLAKGKPSPIFHKVLEHGNKIYIFDDEPCSSNESLLDLNKTTSDVDTDGKSMKIMMPSVVCWEEFIYISGGQVNGKCVDLFERYKPLTDTWEDLPPMPTRRCGHISAILEDKIFACGGMNDMQENLNTVEVFLIAELQWEWAFFPPMKVPRSRFSLVSWKGNLYAAGGAETSGPMYSFEMCHGWHYKWVHATPIYVWDEVGTTKVKIVSFPPEYVFKTNGFDEYDFFKRRP